jgi:hypothetical protein
MEGSMPSHAFSDNLDLLHLPIRLVDITPFWFAHHHLPLSEGHDDERRRLMANLAIFRKTLTHLSLELLGPLSLVSYPHPCLVLLLSTIQDLPNVKFLNLTGQVLFVRLSSASPQIRVEITNSVT